MCGDGGPGREGLISHPLDRTLMPNRIIVCLVLGFIAMVLLYGSIGLFLYSRDHDMKWVNTLRTSKVFEKVRESLNYTTLGRSLPLVVRIQLRMMEKLGDEMVLHMSKTMGGNLSVIPAHNPEEGFPEIMAEKQEKGPIEDVDAAKEKLAKDKLEAAHKNLERTSKAIESNFLVAAFIAALFTNVLYIFPFLFRLRIQYRSRLLKLGLVYMFLPIICIIYGLLEISSIFGTDLAYTDHENLALTNDTGAILLASCRLSPINEFDDMVKNNPTLLRQRKLYFVCQDWDFKLAACLAMIIAGILLGYIGVTLIRHYKNLVNNRIFPPEEAEAMKEEDAQNEVVTTFMAEDKMIQRQRILKQKEDESHARREKDIQNKIAGMGGMYG